MLKIHGVILGALLCALTSCHPGTFNEPGELADHGTGPIPGIAVDSDGPEQVLKTLGKPSSRASGWWRSDQQFDIEFRVWYYKGVGRVIFRPGMESVYATEADKNQTGSPN